MKKLQLELDEKHIPVLVAALEVYSRLRSGQIGMAFDTVYSDACLSWDERELLERVVNDVVYPAEPVRMYDGHGHFYDRYDNVYDDKGDIVEHSEEWKLKKKRHHLNHGNSYFGVGNTDVMRNGTIAWEIKKAIDEYQHYTYNDGCRTMGVDGDGVLNLSGIPNARIVTSEGYWKPEKAFKFPRRYQAKVADAINEENYKKAWSVAAQAFKKTTLPRGSSYRIEKRKEEYHIVIDKPEKDSTLCLSQMK